MDLTASRAILLARHAQAVAALSTPSLGYLRFERVVRPAGAAVSITHTASGLSQADWTRTRHAAAVDALTGRGIDPALAWWVALALVAHYAVETGWGRAEDDYALGNIRAGSGWTGPVHFLQGTDDLAGPAPYRAYASLAEGVEDNVRLATGTDAEGTLLAHSRYQPAFLALLASSGRGPFVTSSGGRTATLPVDAAQWYADLTHAGWHPYSEESMATYRSTLTRAAEYVGAPPAGSSLATAAKTVGGFALAAGFAGALRWWLRRR